MTSYKSTDPHEYAQLFGLTVVDKETRSTQGSCLAAGNDEVGLTTRENKPQPLRSVMFVLVIAFVWGCG